MVSSSISNTFLFFRRESDITKERIEKVLKAGANVVFTTKGIDDMSLKVLFHQLGQNWMLFLLLI
jgi:chaperonin GroEL (HSP60 family)